MIKQHMICKECGSEDITINTNASWSVPTQEWVILYTPEYAYCNNCNNRRNNTCEILTVEEDKAKKVIAALKLKQLLIK